MSSLHENILNMIFGKDSLNLKYTASYAQVEEAVYVTILIPEKGLRCLWISQPNLSSDEYVDQIHIYRDTENIEEMEKEGPLISSFLENVNGIFNAINFAIFSKEHSQENNYQKLLFLLNEIRDDKTLKKIVPNEIKDEGGYFNELDLDWRIQLVLLLSNKVLIDSNKNPIQETMKKLEEDGFPIQPVMTNSPGYMSNMVGMIDMGSKGTIVYGY